MFVVNQTGPLAGIRVLDFTRYQQGPFATVLLCDMGAEVLKVEPPGGEPGRAIGHDSSGFSAYFEAHNRGKLSLVLNLHAEGAVDVVKRLAPSFDIVAENFRPGAMEGMGLGYSDLRAVRTDIILASASAFGRRGPLATRPGYDHVAQAMSGVMVEQAGGAGRSPQALVGGFADQAGAMMMAIGVLGAMVHRHATGEGQHVDSSLIGTMAAMQAMQLTRFLRTGQQVGRQDRRSATYTHYSCADGLYVAIAANTEPMWQRMAAALGLEHLLTDGRFAGAFEREKHKDELVAILEAAFASRFSGDVLDRLAHADVPCAPVLDYAGVRDHPQFRANGYLRTIEHQNFGTLDVVGLPLMFSESPCPEPRGGSELGQHSEHVLLDAGYSWPEIEALRKRGVLG